MCKLYKFIYVHACVCTNINKISGGQSDRNKTSFCKLLSGYGSVSNCRSIRPEGVRQQLCVPEPRRLTSGPNSLCLSSTARKGDQTCTEWSNNSSEGKIESLLSHTILPNLMWEQFSCLLSFCVGYCVLKTV